MSTTDYTNEILNRFNLVDYITPDQYLNEPKTVRRKLPTAMGVYIVIYPYECSCSDDMFMNPGTGGHFKENDPNVSIAVLRQNWVEGADILYIGKAGGISRNGIESNATLKERILALLKFGNGKKIGHWGGRYLWQHKSSPYFRIYWYECSLENPYVLEQMLLSEFIGEYNKRPFANLI